MSYEELLPLLEQIDLRVSAGILAIRSLQVNKGRFTPEAYAETEASLASQIGIAQILSDNIPDFRKYGVEA